MSSLKRLTQIAGLAIVLAAPVLLAGCSGFRPVYGEQGIANARLEMTYGEPGSRLDQIVYQEFVLRFGRSSSPDAPRMTVATSSAPRQLTMTNVTKAQTQFATRVTVTASVQAPDGRVLFSGSRSATAQYSTVGQTLADTEALKDAEERAAKEAAEAMRLALLGALSTQAGS